MTVPVRTRITYELDFGVPVYSIAENSVSILKAFYKALSPRFFLDASHQSLSSAAVLSDFVLRTSLFADNVVISLRLEKFTCELKNIVTEDDLKTVQDSVVLAEDALMKAVPELPIRSASIQVDSWLKSNGVGAALKFGKPERDFNFARIGASGVEHWPTGKFWNEDEGWRAEYRIDRSAIENADLFYHLSVHYVGANQYASADARATHTESLSAGIMENLGLMGGQE